MSGKLEKAKLELEKKFGKNILIKGDDIEKVARISSTGSYLLDMEMRGGIPKGRIMELYGLESSGKTSLAIHFMREVQKVGGNVAFIDVENAFDPDWAETLGLDTSEMMFSQPDAGDDVFEILDALVVTDEVDLIVVDSVGTMATRAELEGDYGDQHMGQLARLMSLGLKKLSTTMKGKKCSILFLNQVRVDIKAYSPTGKPVFKPMGGNALKFYASVRWDIKRGEVIGTYDEPIGFKTKIKIVKSKISPPFRKVELSFYIGGEDDETFGVDNLSETIDIAIKAGVIIRAGAWFKYDEGGKNEVREQGKQKIIDTFRARPDLYEIVKKQAFDIILNKDKDKKGSFNDVATPTEKKEKSKNIKEVDGVKIDMETGEILDEK